MASVLAFRTLTSPESASESASVIDRLDDLAARNALVEQEYREAWELETAMHQMHITRNQKG